MCAIIDADSAHEVFGSNRPEAGVKFFQWINERGGPLAIGGQLRGELNRSTRGFREWSKVAARYGWLMEINDDAVNRRTEELKAERAYKSNDPHILALAQVGGARLLYSNDGDLHTDFKAKRFVDKPRGKIYSTNEFKDFRESHKRLLERKDLCRTKH